MNRQAWLLLLKIRINKIHLVFPVLFPVLLYLVEMLGSLRVYTFGHRANQFYQWLTLVSEMSTLLQELRNEGPMDFVDVEAYEKKEGNVAVKISMW